MAECMTFPEKWEDFIHSFSFTDTDEVYTNGAELISVLRIGQCIEHYFNKSSNNLQQPWWIDVKDRVPEKDGQYLVIWKGFIGGPYRKIAYYAHNLDDVSAYFDEERAGWWTGDSEGDYELTKVTHWMPLPDFPKELIEEHDEMD